MSITVAAGDTVFLQGESGNYMFVVQSGVIEVLVGDTLVEVRGPNEALGFMSVIDQSPRSSTTRVQETAQLSSIDQRLMQATGCIVPIASAIYNISRAQWRTAFVAVA